MYQRVLSPTRYRLSQRSSLLDLILTNEEGMVGELQYLPGLGCSDHLCLLFNFNCYVSGTQKRSTYYKYARGDYDKLRSLLSEIDWTAQMANMSLDEKWSYFRGVAI